MNGNGRAVLVKNMETERTQGGLEPAKIYEVTQKGDKRKGGIEVCCMFNPNQYVISQSNSYSLKANSKAKNKVELTRTGDQTLSLKRLVFDAYMESSDNKQKADPKQKHKPGVTEKTRKLWQLMEPITIGKGKKAPKPRARYAAFEWGVFKFVAVITSVTQTFTLFDREGTPLRAEVDITFKRYEDKEDHQNPTSGTEEIHRVWQVVAGDRLDTIAAEAYGDAGQWSRIAAFNKIDDPLALQPGQELMLPME